MHYSRSSATGEERDCQGLMKEEWSVDSEQSKRKQEVEYFRGGTQWNKQTDEAQAL